MESPDLSRMEEHWNDMQSILQQSTPAVPKNGHHLKMVLRGGYLCNNGPVDFIYQ